MDVVLYKQTLAGYAIMFGVLLTEKPTMKKTKLTPEELSRIRSIAGKKGAANRIAKGNNRGGRPKGSPNKNPSGIETDTRSIMVRTSDHKVFMKCANFVDKPLVDFMTVLAENLKKKNPQLFELRDAIRM